MGYTVQQIKVALELYDKLKKVTATVRQLGYPAKHTLYEWINLRSATEGQFPDIEPKGIKKINRKVQMNYEGFSAKQKLQILKRCFEGTENIRDVAISVGISRVIIYNWRKRYLQYGVLGLQQKKKNIPRTKSLDHKDNLTAQNSVHQSSDEIKLLKQQMKELQMKVDVMTEVFELLKKGQGTDYKSLTNKEKYLIISALKNKYSITMLLKFLLMSRSSYYYVETSKNKADKYKTIKGFLKDIFTHNYECYGYRRLRIALNMKGYIVAEKVVRRLMKEIGIKVFCCKKKRYSSYLGELSPAVPNIVTRNFTATAPNQKWLTDISEFAINAGKIYLSVIRDCFNDEIIASKIELKPTANLANSTLAMAIERLKNTMDKPVVHSDRGCHYRWPKWIKIMTENNLNRSMSKKGCSPDNAACEGFFGRMKNECFYNHTFKDFSLSELKKYLEDYIHWYNNDRIKNKFCDLSPVKYRLSLG